MNKTVKATMWILGVFMVLSLGVYFAGCEGDPSVDATVVEVVCEKAGDACEGGKCFAVTGGKFECFQECTTVGSACDTGTCYFGGTKDQNYCMPTGVVTGGDACATLSECAAGLQCLEMGTMNCYEVCTDACDAGECTDTELGFKVCVAVEA